MIGHKIVIAFDLQIVGFSIPDWLDFHNSVPIDIAAPGTGTGTRRRHMIAHF